MMRISQEGAGESRLAALIDSERSYLEELLGVGIDLLAIAAVAVNEPRHLTVDINRLLSNAGLPSIINKGT